MDSSLFNTILLGDGRLPAGGYSDSAGLEPAVMAGLTLDNAFGYMEARLHTLTRMEAAASVLSNRMAGKSALKADFEELEDAVNARTPAPAQRKASRFMGRAFLYLGEGIFPEFPGFNVLNEMTNPPTRGVALGVMSSALSVAEGDCAQVCCYDDMQRITEAILKLLPTDPVLVTKWLIEIGKMIPEIVEEAIRVKTPSELPAVNAPWMEHWAEEHDRKEKRLFMA